MVPATVTNPSLGRYVIISPVKDEEDFVAATLQSVVSQSVLPQKWIIVDDGSSDNTPKILEEHAAIYSWIEIIRIERDSKRDLGITEIRAFLVGCERVKELEWDFIVKLDCDLTLPQDYFQTLIAEFDRCERLGIASGLYLERWKDEWFPVQMPSYHAAGASKVVRRQCYEEIGGFVLCRGWDTIDEIRAQVHGWQTRHFSDVTFHHLRREGSATGFSRTNLLHGEVYYVTGGGGVFFAFKVLHRMVVGSPPILAGLTMLWGYLKCLLSGAERSVSKSEARFYRHMLAKRVFDRGRRSREEAWGED
jgi:glycosyltransferase involved in cell wall biosynthesis